MAIIALARGVDYSVTGAAQMPPNAFPAESTFSSKFRIFLLKVMVRELVGLVRWRSIENVRILQFHSGATNYCFSRGPQSGPKWPRIGVDSGGQDRLPTAPKLAEFCDFSRFWEG
jgi:hypothetical protein